MNEELVNIWPEEISRSFLKISNKKEGQFKLILGGFKTNEHLTIGFYDNSKTVDIHIKNEETGEYNSLFKMNYLRFFVILRSIGMYQQELMLHYVFKNRINPGKLGRHKLWMLHNHKSDDKHDDIIRYQKRKTKLKINSKKNLNDIIEDFEPAKNIKYYESGLASVYDNNFNPKGFLFKFEGVGTFFFKQKHWNEMLKLLLINSFYFLKTQNFDKKKFVLNYINGLIKEKYPLAYNELTFKVVN